MNLDPSVWGNPWHLAGCPTWNCDLWAILASKPVIAMRNIHWGWNHCHGWVFFLKLSQRFLCSIWTTYGWRVPLIWFHHGCLLFPILNRFKARSPVDTSGDARGTPPNVGGTPGDGDVFEEPGRHPLDRGHHRHGLSCDGLIARNFWEETMARIYQI